jgi:hypothetical protein
MATIVTRAGKGSALTHNQVDANFNNLNTDKLEFTSEPVRHSVRPSLLLDFANTKTLDPRITFTRASTGTFYDGKTVAKAEENLVLQSQTFDNASWTKNDATVTANAATAPDGTSTADSLIENSATAVHRVRQVSAIVSGAHQWSVYAKANTRSWVILGIGDNIDFYRTWFNLSTGAVGTVPANITASITDAGNGWYRCSVYIANAVAASSSSKAIELATGDNISSYAGDDTSGIYIWGAQLENRTTLTAYQVTTTAPITNYIPALQTAASGVARFEHNPTTGESLGLEIEEQRTNLFLRSQEFNTTWAIGATATGAITADQAIGLDGNQTADLFYDLNTNNNIRVIEQSISLTTATSYTMSCFVKANGNNFALLRVGQAATGNNIIVYYNLSTGAVGTATRFANANSPTIIASTITPVGNSWYRIAVSFTANVTSSHYCQIGMSQADNTFNYVGNGFSGIYIWGAQLEAGAFASSYIPTVASTVTRAADSASMTGTNFSSWYRADEGTLYGETSLANLSGNANDLINISDNSFNNQIRLCQASGSNFGIRIDAGGVTQANIFFSPSITSLTQYKLSAVYKLNDIAGTNNSNTVGTDTLATIPVVNIMRIGAGGLGATNFNGTIKKIAYYPKRLQNSELVSLTTI